MSEASAVFKQRSRYMFLKLETVGPYYQSSKRVKSHSWVSSSGFTIGTYFLCEPPVQSKKQG